jgi:hypothetical protein
MKKPVPKALRAITFYSVQRILIQEDSYKTLKDKRKAPFQVKPLSHLASEFEEGDRLFVIPKETWEWLKKKQESEDD